MTRGPRVESHYGSKAVSDAGNDRNIGLGRGHHMTPPTTSDVRRTHAHLVLFKGPFKVDPTLSDDHSTAVPLVIQPQPHVFLTSGKNNCLMLNKVSL